MTTWLGGILELTSKVRYGLTSRGSPLYRFIPYDKRFSPLAVGSSTRDFTTNVHVIIEPSKQGKPGQMNHGNLVKTLGPPTPVTETEVLLLTYAYDNTKEFRKEAIPSSPPPPEKRERCEVKDGFTFHIDPSGCMDVDDAFTFIKTPTGWRVMIHIADVDYWIGLGSEVDISAKQRATTFYCSNGFALAPMLPSAYSENEASLLPGSQKPALSLVFDWVPGKPVGDVSWMTTRIQTQKSFTYDSVMGEVHTEYISALRQLAAQLGGDINDSHTWVEELMIFYNEHAGILLQKNGRGILRRHSAPTEEKLRQIALLEEKGFEHLCMEAAEYCLATEQSYHYGLRKNVYAYASSPLRRYADLINQRILKDILRGHTSIPNPSQEDINHLNIRQKQSKKFSRDVFFMRMVYEHKSGGVEGFVIERASDYTKVWIPEWKRVIKVREHLDPTAKWFHITWYADMALPGWKQRVIYSAKPLH